MSKKSEGPVAEQSEANAPTQTKTVPIHFLHPRLINLGTLCGYAVEDREAKRSVGDWRCVCADDILRMGVREALKHAHVDATTMNQLCEVLPPLIDAYFSGETGTHTALLVEKVGTHPLCLVFHLRPPGTEDPSIDVSGGFIRISNGAIERYFSNHITAIGIISLPLNLEK